MGEAEFLEIHRQTAEPLRRYAARVLGNVEAADDVVQETYLRILRYPGCPADPAQVRLLLFRIAGNLMVDQWRRRGREASRAFAVPVPPQEDPGLRLDMARLFGRLSLRERQLIWLAHVEGADTGDIARAVGVGAGSVKVLLHRARKKLAQWLREEDPRKGVP